MKLLTVKQILVVILGLMALSCGIQYEKAPQDAVFDEIKVKMPRSQVLQKLGDPTQVFTPQNPPKERHVLGYAFPHKRPIENELLVFIGHEYICCVYLDKNDQVEHIFIGGS